MYIKCYCLPQAKCRRWPPRGNLEETMHSSSPELLRKSAIIVPPGIGKFVLPEQLVPGVEVQINVAPATVETGE